jgi:hypothetical protein
MPALGQTSPPKISPVVRCYVFLISFFYIVERERDGEFTSGFAVTKRPLRAGGRGSRTTSFMGVMVALRGGNVKGFAANIFRTTEKHGRDAEKDRSA